MKKIKWEVKKSTIIKLICWCVLVLVIMLGIKGVFTGSLQDDYNNEAAGFLEVTVGEAEIVQQLTLTGTPENLNFIYKSTGTGNETLRYELKSIDGSVTYKQEEVRIPGSLGEEQLATWDISEAELGQTTQVAFSIQDTENTEKIKLCVQNDTESASYLENGQAQALHLRMSVVYSHIRYYGFFVLFAGVLFIIGAACILAWDYKLPLPKLFVIIALAGGIGIAAINPLAQEPDGLVHFIRALDVSYGNVLAPFINNAHEGGYNAQPANLGEVQLQVVAPGTQGGLSYMGNLMSMKFSKETVLAPGECGYTSLFYMPQALGTLIGRILNLSVYGCMLLGRLVNLLCYVALVYWALKVIPVYKNLLAVLALMPMSIYQAASYSPDALLMGLCFLFTAVCFAYAFGEKQNLGWKQGLLLGVLLALLFMCKYVYICLGLLVFLIPKAKFKDKKTYWKSFGIALLPVVFIVAVYAIKILCAAGMPAAVETGAAVQQAATMTQMDYVLANPKTFLKILCVAVINLFGRFGAELNLLGWMNYSLTFLQVVLPCFMVAVAVLDTQGIKGKVKISHKVLYLITAAVVTVLGIAGLYLMDINSNPVGAPAVLGYQIRYTIPCMLPLFAALGSEKVENGIAKFHIKVVGVMGAFLLYTILRLLQLCY